MNYNSGIMRMKTKGARIWGRGEDFELVKENSEKYVSKGWKSSTKESSVTISGKEIDEGTYFDISAYTSDRDKVGDLAERLLNLVLSGNNKAEFVIIELYDHIESDKELYRESIQTVKENYKTLRQLLVQRLNDDPKVKTLSQDKKPIVVFPPVTLLCELQSEHANKITLETTDSDFSYAINLLHSLIDGLIEQGMARRAIGYKLWADAEALEIFDVHEEDGKIYVDLAYPAHSKMNKPED